jgi:SAM-dependent methyltransferase
MSGVNRPGWLRDEAASAGRENLDAEHVSRYDSKEDADAATEVALLKGLGLGSESIVVEFGAGTGQFTVTVAKECANVIAIDVSPLMLNQLRANAAGLGNVTVVEAGFLTYEHQGPPADFLYSRYALHHLPDFWKGVALHRARGMLRPGGLFRLWDVVYNFEAAQAIDRIEAWCSSAGENVDGEWIRPEYEEHVRDEHSTFTWILEPMIERVGFSIETREYSEDGIFAKYLLRPRP